MSDPDTRRGFLRTSAAAAAAFGLSGPAASGHAMTSQHYICVTCGMQYWSSPRTVDSV